MAFFDPERVARTVFAVTQTLEDLSGRWHACGHAQLVVPGEGVLDLRTEDSRWVIPPRHAVWLPPGMLHSMSAQGPVRMTVLYVRSVRSDAEGAEGAEAGSGKCTEADDEAGFRAAGNPLPLPLPVACRAMTVDRLVDALLAEVAALPLPAGAGSPHADADAAAARLVRVLLDRLPGLPAAPLGLSLPRDPRIRRIADALSAAPAQPAILDELAEAAGVTARTAARLFVRQTGRTFGQWRQQLRLLAALQRLGAGAAVTQVALEVGYHDVSSFIAVFRDAFGDTPARYFR